MRVLARNLNVRQPALLRARPGSQVSRTDSVPAPVGGWNARDPIGQMDPKDAITLDNWWPLPSFLRVRRGQIRHARSLPSTVESLLPYNAANGTAALFAASSTSFYDVTSAGVVGAAVVSSLTNARWDSVNFTNSSGTSYLCCFNGVDSPRFWDGTTWTAITAASTPAITGVTPSLLLGPTVFKRRIFAIETGTLNAWYLPVDAVGGAATKLSLAGIARRGGKLVALGTWTIDAGEGSDDHFVAVTSEGDVIVYKGTDPSSSSTWAVIGVWALGSPVGGTRCLTQFAGDMLYLCTDGLVPLSAALQTTRTNSRVALSDKIENALRDSISSYSSNFGWSVSFFPTLQMICINVPVDTSTSSPTYYQYVMNTISKAWARFTSLNARCWVQQGTNIFYGDNTLTRKYDAAEYDEDTSGTSVSIATNVKQAFHYFGARGQLKKFNMARPIFLADNSPSVLLGLNVDYEDAAPSSSLSFTSAGTAGKWDIALWDSGLWGGTPEVLRPWQTLPTKPGMCAALRMMLTQKNIKVEWHSTDWLYELGGVVG